MAKRDKPVFAGSALAPSLAETSPAGRWPYQDAARIRPAISTMVAGAILLTITATAAAFPSRWASTVGNLTQLGAAGSAFVGCWRTSRSTDGRMRQSWAAVALGCAAWAAGQVVYTFLEARYPGAVPFPSLADVGFLLFPIGAIACLLLFPPAGSAGARFRSVLDGVALLASLLALTWTLTRVEWIEDAPAGLTLAVRIAYPAGDILIIALAYYAVSRPTRHRLPLLLLASGVSAMALADAAFADLKDASSNLPELGWVAAFLFLAFAGGTGGRLLAQDRASGASPPASQPAGATMLPYFPLTLAVTGIGIGSLVGQEPTGVELAAVAVALVAVLTRQYLTLRENRLLLDVVAAREQQLVAQAFADQLTGLANRALFTDRVSHALDLRRRDLRPLGLLFCDLDDFKAVNDTLGHGVGDDVLVAVGHRLRDALRDGDTLARFGGDEFAILLEDGSDPTTVASRIIDALHEPFAVDDSVINVSVSVGVTSLDGKQAIPTLDELLARADLAMYSAKRAGKGQQASYDPTMVLPAAVDLQLREPLRLALRTGRITAVYQPIIDLADGHMAAVETLARWMHKGVQVSPVDFIPLAGRSGLLTELTDHMLDQACGQLASWMTMFGDRALKTGVNIPPQLIVDPDFPTRVAAVLSRHDVRPEQLVLEITEDALLSDLPMARAVCARLRQIGTSLSLDDFGTGYSSLLHLQQIPLDALKIDISFVANIDRDAEAERFMRAFLELGRNLGLTVTAEGVEREEQAATLRRLGCPMAQGFLFARPGPAADLESTFLRPGAVWTPRVVQGRRTVRGRI